MPEETRLLHLALQGDWKHARRTGEYRTSTLGLTLEQQGFIHLSFPNQLATVAAAHYAEVSEPLVVLEIDRTALGSAVAVEPGDDGGDLFPHLYGPLPVAAVVRVRPVRIECGQLVDTD